MICEIPPQLIIIGYDLPSRLLVLPHFFLLKYVTKLVLTLLNMSPIYFLTHEHVLTQLVMFKHNTNLYYLYWTCIYVHVALPLPPLELVLTPFIPQNNAVQLHIPIHLH
jgi:hypothetical protein